MDEIARYFAIHGLPHDPECHAVYDRALARIRDFANSLSLPLTLFVVARDVERERNRAELAQAVADGHEIGNHSLDHWYDLTRRERSEQVRQVIEANAQIQALLGVRAVGFRAPGYTVTDELLFVLRDAGFSYDSSVFPCPAYYTAKAATLFAMKLWKRSSHSVLDAPQVLRAPTVPYRTGVPYYTRGTGLLELPIQVVGPLRVPFIGTSLTFLGPSAARLLTLSLVGTPFVNLELHGVDFLDGADVPPALLRAQPDLHISVARKLKTLTAVLETLRSRGYTAVRLDEAARAFSTS